MHALKGPCDSAIRTRDLQGPSYGVDKSRPMRTHSIGCCAQLAVISGTVIGGFLPLLREARRPFSGSDCHDSSMQAVPHVALQLTPIFDWGCDMQLLLAMKSEYSTSSRALAVIPHNA
jgi:hypothetical protein